MNGQDKGENVGRPREADRGTRSVTDDLSRTIYSCGASLYRVKPLGIVQPRHKLDVIKTVQYAAERGIPITPRGGGTSRAGNEIGEGILLDFSKYMNNSP